MNICALSGQVLQKPMISKKTGHVFEKELILKHIESTGQCPVTGQELSSNDLVEINCMSNNLLTKPRLSNSGSLPDVLKKIQSEWDILLLENFQMKKQLQEIREEMTHNLYQHEAASLVICRLIKEKEEALRQLNLFKAHLEEIKNEEEERIEEGEEFEFMGIYRELIDRINESAESLIGMRKNRKIPEQLATVDNLKSYHVKGSFPLHSSSKPGITCLDIHSSNDNLILTGGVDGKVVLFDNEKESALYNLENAHSKRINDVQFYKNSDLLGFSIASSDNTASFWLNTNDELNFTERYRTKVHKGAVTSISFHPLKDYCIFGSRDGCWSFHNLIKGVCLTKVKSDTAKEITKCQFHPDGSILGTGENNGLVKLWDLSVQQDSASSTIEAHKTEISGLSFSENGYYLATSAIKDRTVKIIDLRKSQILRKIELPENYEIRSVQFDYSGSYLGIVGSTVNLYHVKTNSIFAEFNDHTDIVTDIKFAQNCRYFATTSLDRNLKIFNQ